MRTGTLSKPRNITREDVDRVVIGVTSNAMSYPNPVRMIGQDTSTLRKKIVDAVWTLLQEADSDD